MTATDQPTIAPHARGSVVWRRRRAAAARTWFELWAEPQGKAGVIVLGIAILVAVLAPPLLGQNVLSIIAATGRPFQSPSLHYPLGTDEYGRSVLSLLAWGARPSLIIGFSAAIIAMVIGTAIGVSSGHYGGWVDTVLMRFDDWALNIPFLPLVIVLQALLGRGTDKTILVLGITSWPGTARILRAQVLSVKARPFMDRARALGASNMHQMVKHTLPNIMPLVLANTTITIAGAILAESTLAFLGLGSPSLNATSWGSMLDGAFTAGAVSRGAWAYLLAPGLAIAIVVLAFTWCGNALEKVLTPRLQSR
ncbi:MAG TPA: ABC transporter permease [Micromonosporaceae bacterium]|nr:ABC transporter permease [Micromonosporaceae bacterium]